MGSAEPLTKGVVNMETNKMVKVGVAVGLALVMSACATVQSGVNNVTNNQNGGVIYGAAGVITENTSLK